MTEESKVVFRGIKCAEIIEAISKLYGLSLKKATDIYYRSETSQLIEEGIADLHCRSSIYLAECIADEYNETISTPLKRLQ